MPRWMSAWSCGADDALMRQHFGVGQRALDVEFGQALVEKDRGRVAFDQIGDRFGEAGRPGLAFFGELCCHNYIPVNSMIIKHAHLIPINV